MSFAKRLSLSIVLVVTGVLTAVAWLQIRFERRHLERDIAVRAQAIVETVAPSLESLIQQANKNAVRGLLEKLSDRRDIKGVALFDRQAEILYATPNFPLTAFGLAQSVPAIMAGGNPEDRFHDVGKVSTYVQITPLGQGENASGALVTLFEASSINERVVRLWRVNFIRWLLLAVLISLTAVFLVHWNLLKPLRKMVPWARSLRLGETMGPPPVPEKGPLMPLAEEVLNMAQHLARAQAAAEREARLRDSAQSIWTPERLKEHVKARLEGKPLFIIANREPYMHVQNGREIKAVQPASGLVTALEPILLAVDGTWIGHGSGDADRQTADEHSRLRLPPDHPRYTLRRVWLSTEEEQGYYFGFANEGLWPLCHIAHTRPIFRAEDWAYYQKVNQKFTEAALEEMAETENPIVLIQDYHFALLPRLIKDRRPDARVGLFWHIPWPNPEGFGICPWQRDLLRGMLGADLLGFHTQFHCNNFLETVDRALESRIAWDSFSVTREGHVTRVKPFPIGIDVSGVLSGFEPAGGQNQPPAKADLFARLGVKSEFMGVGVDRIDYTKGIVERFRAIERFLEKYAHFRGRFTFVELGAPSRSAIPRYQEMNREIEQEERRINEKLQTKEWRPIVLLKGQHAHRDIGPYYQAGDLCMVTSLHDGMNLVAKEYIAAKEKEDGVLILSRFAGASYQLGEALIVNPYDTDQMADAIHAALTMPAEEKQTRMRHLRRAITEHNIYRWAAALMNELTSIRPEPKRRRFTAPA